MQRYKSLILKAAHQLIDLCGVPPAASTREAQSSSSSADMADTSPIGPRKRMHRWWRHSQSPRHVVVFLGTGFQRSSSGM